MGSLKGPVPTGQTVFCSSDEQHHPLGALFEDNFGRKYRYCLVGGTSLVVGNCIQSPAEVPNHQGDQMASQSAAAIGDNTLTQVLGGTLASVDQYAEGFAMVTTTPGLGYAYPIRTHPAAASGASLTVTLEPGWEVVVALTTTSRVTLVLNPYKGVIQSPATTLTGSIRGVAPFVLVNAEFGWLGVHGPFATLVEDTIGAVSKPVACPSGTAGAADPHTSDLVIIGDIMRDAVAQPLNTEVYWRLG